jgi:hypothetical protein
MLRLYQVYQKPKMKNQYLLMQVREKKQIVKINSGSERKSEMKIK